MKLRLSIKKTAAAALAAGMFVGAMSSAAPAVAKPKAPEKLDRKAVIARAKSWTSKRVPYSQAGYKSGYRRDCSGFIAMAWNLPENFVTFNIPTVAKRIRKDQLQPGDILLNTGGGVGGRHVVMFEKWANKSKTKYYLLEQTGANGVDSAIRRVMPYPYKFDKSLYKPYRFKSMDGYWSAVQGRQPVKGYKLIDGAKKASKPKKATVKAVAKRPADEATGAPKPAPAAPAAQKTPPVNGAFLGALIGWFVGQ